MKTRRCTEILMGLFVVILASGILTRVSLAAEASRFLVSYGGTAG